MVFTDESTVKIDAVVLPGIFKSIEIKGDAIIDEQEVEGQSKKPKQATGYEDVKITLELILEDGPVFTKGEKLEIIQYLFRTPGQERPEVHEIVNAHTATRGVKQVILKGLTHKAENKKQQILVTLELWEYTVMTITAEEVSKSTTSKEKTKKMTSKGQNTSAASQSCNLSESYQNYLKERGTAPAFKNTPAQDTAAGAGYLGTVKSLP